MITPERYFYAKQVFEELTKWVADKRRKWFAQFGKEMPDDFIPFETFLTIDEMFIIIARYQKQQKQPEKEK
jgi:hypothetical protein